MEIEILTTLQFDFSGTIHTLLNQLIKYLNIDFFLNNQACQVFF